jgi:hypothetical protein
MGNLLRNASLPLLVLSLAACQSTAPRAAPAPTAASPANDLRSLLGEYDNHAQYLDTAAGIAPPALHQWLRTTSESRSLLWQLRAADGSAEGRWLLREENGVLVPYRPVGATASAAFEAKTDDYRFKAEEWAPLRPCALVRERSSVFAYRADAGACSALLSGLGASASLLPQSFSLSGDTLTLATVSDTARGAAANTVSHRVRWFGGWDALNGAGPKAGAENKDWHLRRDLRLHSEGDRVPLRWRDGVESGYSLELARLIYRESNTEVLRLAVIDDATGKVLSYAWANPDATRIGLNLGWVQVGLEQGVAPDPGKSKPEPRAADPARK